MKTIVIADDEEIERRYLKNLFNRQKEYNVIGEARNGVEVIKLVEKLQPNIIIMDIYMPMMNGLDSAYKIKKHSPDTLIILNTAYADFEFAKKALDYHLDAYLLKPAKEQQILETIQACFKYNDYFSDKYTNNIKISDISEKPVEILKEYIERNSCRDIRLEELAELVHFTPSYVSKLFRQETGQTLKEYINTAKIKMAKRFLEETEQSIQEIASSSGFNSISHFNRVFRQHTDMSPHQYRMLILTER